MSSLWNASKIIKEFKPDIAIGVGGYASGPLLKRANARNVKPFSKSKTPFLESPINGLLEVQIKSVWLTQIWNAGSPKKKLASLEILCAHS